MTSHFKLVAQFDCEPGINFKIEDVLEEIEVSGFRGFVALDLRIHPPNFLHQVSAFVGGNSPGL